MDTMGDLYAANVPAAFWRVARDPPIPTARWRQAVERAATVLPEAARSGGLDARSLLEATLGEGQFGPGHWRLSQAKRLYYVLRPIVPRRAVLALRRLYRLRQQGEAALNWPIEERYVRFVFETLRTVMALGGDTALPFIHFWPDSARYALVLTHDVETAHGQAFVRELADLEEEYGFRSSFNFCAQAYPLDRELMAELRERGFEVGVHGLRHDGWLFASQAEFERRAAAINATLAEWGAVGYRSPLTHRH